MAIKTGAYRVFYTTDALTPSVIDNIISTGQIPNTIQWKQIFTKGDTTITFNRDKLNLETNQQGLVKVVYSSVENVEIKIPVADVSYETLVKLKMINPTDITTTSPRKVLRGSYKGVDASQNSITLLLYDFSVDPSNNSDVPSPTNDDMAFLFFKTSSTSGGEITFSPDNQMLIEITLQVFAVDGSTNKGVLGAMGSFTIST